MSRAFNARIAERVHLPTRKGEILNKRRTTLAALQNKSPARFCGTGRGFLLRSSSCAASLVSAYGAAGLRVDSDQPMRSCPYWFQIGFLPPLNEV